MSKIVVTTRIATDLASELDRLADKLGRSRGWVVARAIERFVAEELSLLDSLDEAEAQIDRGEFYTQDEMKAWFAARHPVDRAA